jgi:adenine-specific DNA glycosylase
MLQAAKMVTENHGGIFPNNRESLMNLSGIGPYTAAAIQAFVYNEPLLSFDTNLEKIFSRYYHGTRFQKLTKEEKLQIAKDFQQSGISGRAINAACMDFGSLVSLNQKPSSVQDWMALEHSYPLQGCKWIESRGMYEIQAPKKKRVFPTKDASIRVVLHENHTLYYSSKNT